MFEYRVTKYDPTYRDEHGSYTRDEWICISDIGSSFDGVILTEVEYRRVEDAYVATAIAFLQEAGVDTLSVNGLENHGGVQLTFFEGSLLGMDDIKKVIRQMLRAEYWCRLVSEDAFVHVGYDYYMYVGVANYCGNAIDSAGKLGLFVESFHSPYRIRDSARPLPRIGDGLAHSASVGANSGHPPRRPSWKYALIALIVIASPCFAIRMIGCVSDIREVMRSPQEQLARDNEIQLNMLAKRRTLFEGCVTGDAQSLAELKASTNVKFLKSGACYRFEWWSEAPSPFTCMKVLLYCPNGQRDLDTSATNRHYLMQIDEHWFAASENCG